MQQKPDINKDRHTTKEHFRKESVQKNFMPSICQ